MAQDITLAHSHSCRASKPCLRSSGLAPNPMMMRELWTASVTRHCKSLLVYNIQFENAPLCLFQPTQVSDWICWLLEVIAIQIRTIVMLKRRRRRRRSNFASWTAVVWFLTQSRNLGDGMGFAELALASEPTFARLAAWGQNAIRLTRQLLVCQHFQVRRCFSWQICSPVSNRGRFQFVIFSWKNYLFFAFFCFFLFFLLFLLFFFFFFLFFAFFLYMLSKLLQLKSSIDNQNWLKIISFLLFLLFCPFWKRIFAFILLFFAFFFFFFVFLRFFSFFCFFLRVFVFFFVFSFFFRLFAFFCHPELPFYTFRQWSPFRCWWLWVWILGGMQLTLSYQVQDQNTFFWGVHNNRRWKKPQAWILGLFDSQKRPHGALMWLLWNFLFVPEQHHRLVFTCYGLLLVYPVRWWIACVGGPR